MKQLCFVPQPYVLTPGLRDVLLSYWDASVQRPHNQSFLQQTEFAFLEWTGLAYWDCHTVQQITHWGLFSAAQGSPRFPFQASCKIFDSLPGVQARPSHVGLHKIRSGEQVEVWVEITPSVDPPDLRKVRYEIREVPHELSPSASSGTSGEGDGDGLLP